MEPIFALIDESNKAPDYLRQTKHYNCCPYIRAGGVTVSAALIRQQGMSWIYKIGHKF